MGLKKAIPDRFGNGNPNAHIEVLELSLFQLNSEARIAVGIWKDKPAQAVNTPFEQETFVATGADFDDHFSKAELLKPGVEPYKNAETYLKTLPKFSGAEDED